MNTLEEKLNRTFIPHLKTQFQRGIPVLFTGAGFSLEAETFGDQKLPSYEDLQLSLWELSFPDEQFDHSSLQDLYDHALQRHPRQTEELLRNLLTINPSTLPDWYGEVFSLPWYRCYTLNIDNMADAANSAFDLPRSLRAVSAKHPTNASGNSYTACLDVIHLNGTLDDLPHKVTFSLTQYADRLAHPDPYYLDFAADLVSRPVIIIGTRLDEPPLWQHIEYRRTHGGRELRELRPRSYLVTPELARARRALLADLNIEWIPMTAEQFMERVLKKVQKEAQVGLSIVTRSIAEHSDSLPLVADLATKPHEATEFLLGQEPIWADLQSGRAAQRTIDTELWTKAKSSMEGSKGRLIVVTGTAGSGKSTSLMRVCLHLQGQGTSVAWIDREHMLSQRIVRREMNRDDSPRVLAIDDADMYGASLSSLIRDLVGMNKSNVVFIAVRSNKIDKILNTSLLNQIEVDELAMPYLTNDDIDGLIDVLDEYNRLGFMKGLPRDKQRSHFQHQAGRQLLVAMIQATSGRRFDEKVIDELGEMGTDSAKIYAFVAVAHSFRFGLMKDELYIATGNVSNEILNATDRLINRRVLRLSSSGFIWARHRLLAEIIHDELQKAGQLKGVIEGLAHLAATKARPNMPTARRPRKMLQVLLSHDYLLRVVGLEVARNLYTSLESVLRWDYHYWLQRGSLEVEVGDLNLAEQFLSQAKSIAGGDPMVQNEWAYLLLRRAIEDPQGKDSPKLVKEATEILEDLIGMPDRLSSYPYHVLGSQGLAWSRRGISGQNKGHYLRMLLSMLEEGIQKFPRERDLLQLRDDLKREYLSIAVST